MGLVMWEVKNADIQQGFLNSQRNVPWGDLRFQFAVRGFGAPGASEVIVNHKPEIPGPKLTNPKP